jgi:hypothetical protein
MDGRAYKIYLCGYRVPYWLLRLSFAANGRDGMCKAPHDMIIQNNNLSA